MENDQSNDLLGFGERLREERERLGMSQAEAAERAGVRRQMWGKYERDEATPGMNVVARFCGHGADVQYLISGQRSKPAAYRPPIDMKLISEAIAAVDAELERKKEELPVDSRVRVYNGVYEMSLPAGKLNTVLVPLMVDAAVTARKQALEESRKNDDDEEAGGAEKPN